MKKIIIALLAISMPLFVNAQSSGLFSKKKIKTQQDLSAYMAGAVPEIDNKVAFTTTIAAPGKSKSDIFTALASWANLRYTPEQARGDWRDADFFKNTEYALVSKADKDNGTIECKGAEEMIFSNKPLAKDYTLAYYTLTLKISDGSVSFDMHNISYVYAGGSENPERVTAEEWITDKEAFNKKGELRRVSGKFRVKTIDLKDELIKEITNAIQ